ncbi:MAG: FxsA family protein [Pseudomonadota bacterium]
MPALIFLLGLPLAEIALFVVIGDEIGVSGVLLWIFFSALAGMILIRAQGRHMIEQARSTMEKRAQPAAEAMAGLGAILGGVLLIIPGFLTDMIGLAFALPGIGKITAGWLHQGLQQRAQGHSTGPFPGGQNPQGSAQQSGTPPVIDGEFTVVDDNTQDQAAPDKDPVDDGGPDDRKPAGSSGGSVPPYGG